MSSHLHIVLRTRPDILLKWSNEEVARRYLSINRLVRSKEGKHFREPTEAEIAAETADPKRMSVLRVRLASISKFMAALDEHIARRANREDDCRGRFFEGRFGCRRLDNEAAVLACGIYVDLNQIRAGEALTPEESKFTSAYQRIVARQQRLESQDTVPADGWLCELTLNEVAEEYETPTPSVTGRRATDKGLLPIGLDDYLKMLDFSGRQLREGKSGAIPDHLAPILDRLRINKDHWLDVVAYLNFSGIMSSFRRSAHLRAHLFPLASIRPALSIFPSFGQVGRRRTSSR